jgi:hypothetical protein
MAEICENTAMMEYSAGLPNVSSLLCRTGMPLLEKEI